MSIQNYKIAEIFLKIADLLKIEGANVFRVRAYREAGRTIEGYPKPINKKTVLLVFYWTVLRVE